MEEVVSPRPIEGRAVGRTLAAALAVSLAAVLGVYGAWPAVIPSKSVHAAASDVILVAADIPDIGWGLRSAGMNGSGVWHLFGVHNELILALLNVTLWVEPDADRAAALFSSITRSIGRPTEAGSVLAADASSFWFYGTPALAGMVVQRYNVVFLLDAYLETSFSLTKSDFGVWAGWQLTKIESFAA